MSDLVRFFEGYKNKKIAIYGLGTESEKAIKALDNDFEIVGLLDGFREEGNLYGKPVISLQEAIDERIALIVVAARPGSCRAIVKRIGEICRGNGIFVMDIRGKDLLASSRITYNFSQISGDTKEKLSERIKEAEVVSFDLFDTLVMRQTLSSDDVPELVNCRLEEQEIFIQDFASRRIASEKELSKEMAPTLTKIYDNMLVKLDANLDVKGMTAEKLADLEWKIDYDLLIPRQEVCNIFRKAVADQKEVYVVSDTYYSREQLSKILSKCGLTEYKDILPSSKYGTGKMQQLYCVLNDKEYGKKCLHIGDDMVADIECAASWGIEPFRLWSGIDLLEAAGNLGLADDMDELSGRLKIGMFVSKIFNSPFQFEEGGRKIAIQNAYDLGYLLFAPIISDFVIWFEEQAERSSLSNIWFCARDGYLIKQMYDELHGGQESTYFLTSRTAAIRAGMESREDIAYVADMKFSGTIEEQLQERFGIAKQNAVVDHGAGGNELTDYSDAIVRKASEDRKNYQRYIDQLPMKEGDIAFFDFVAKGTSQMYIQRLVDRHLKGLYFMQLEREYMQKKRLDILPFYTGQETENSEIYENYYILETILTSPQPSIKEFDEYGKPCYAQETRKERDIRCVQEVQNGVLDYFKAYLKVCPRTERVVDKRLGERFLSLIHGVAILDQNLIELKVEDPFFNRMTAVSDLI